MFQRKILNQKMIKPKKPSKKYCTFISSSPLGKTGMSRKAEIAFSIALCAITFILTKYT